jgi:hypothetical protein
LSEHEFREIAGYAADCARSALSVFEQRLPADARLREAIDAAHAFAGGGQRTGAPRQSAWAASERHEKPLHPLRLRRHERQAMRPPLRTFIPRQALIR